MSRIQQSNFQEYYMSYKNAFSIIAEYHLNMRKTTIILEIRKGGKVGCELYTKINGVPYSIYSRLLRGSFNQLLMELPEKSFIKVPHMVFIDNMGHVDPVIIIEEIGNSRIDNSLTVSNYTKQTFITLHCEYGDQIFQTRSYETDEVYEALDELLNSVEKFFSISISICPRCIFIKHYANTAICLRDLSPEEIMIAEKKLKGHDSLNILGLTQLNRG